jgi:hypothetical protein
VTPATAIAVLAVAVNPVVEYTLVTHPAEVPRLSVTVTVPTAPLTVPPGLVVPPDSATDAGTAMDNVPAETVSVKD